MARHQKRATIISNSDVERFVSHVTPTSSETGENHPITRWLFNQCKFIQFDDSTCQNAKHLCVSFIMTSILGNKQVSLETGYHTIGIY